MSAKWSTREALAASGLEYTYVVNTLFLEFMFTPPVHWDVANGSVTLKVRPAVALSSWLLRAVPPSLGGGRPASPWPLCVADIPVPHPQGKTDTPFTVTSLVDIGRWMPQVLKDPASK